MKRNLTGVAAIGLFLASIVSGGCQNSMYEENSDLHTQNRRLQSTLAEHRSLVQQIEAEKASYAAAVAERDRALAERDQMIQDLQSKLNAPDVATGISPLGIDNVGVAMNEMGELVLTVQGDVLFPSGSTKLNNSAEATLARIADVLKSDFGARAIRVEGHTDTDPINKTKNLYSDNRDLSLQRAYSVTKFLETKGVDPAKIETVGHGQYKPKGADKKSNRRVEIIVATAR